jgi:hypothetical protein
LIGFFAFCKDRGKVKRKKGKGKRKKEKVKRKKGKGKRGKKREKGKDEGKREKVKNQNEFIRLPVIFLNYLGFALISRQLNQVFFLILLIH